MSQTAFIRKCLYFLLEKTNTTIALYFILVAHEKEEFNRTTV